MAAWPSISTRWFPAGIPPSHAICTDAIPLYIVFHIPVFNLKFLFCCHKGYGRTLDFLKTFIPLLASPASTSLLCSLMSIVNSQAWRTSGFLSRCPSLMLLWSTVPSSIDPLHLTISEGSLIRHPTDALPCHATPSQAKSSTSHQGKMFTKFKFDLFSFEFIT